MRLGLILLTAVILFFGACGEDDLEFPGADGDPTATATPDATATVTATPTPTETPAL